MQVEFVKKKKKKLYSKAKLNTLVEEQNKELTKNNRTPGIIYTEG